MPLIDIFALMLFRRYADFLLLIFAPLRYVDAAVPLFSLLLII